MEDVQFPGILPFEHNKNDGPVSPSTIHRRLGPCRPTSIAWEFSPVWAEVLPVAANPVSRFGLCSARARKVQESLTAPCTRQGCRLESCPDRRIVGHENRDRAMACARSQNGRQPLPASYQKTGLTNVHARNMD